MIINSVAKNPGTYFCDQPNNSLAFFSKIRNIFNEFCGFQKKETESSFKNESEILEDFQNKPSYPSIYDRFTSFLTRLNDQPREVQEKCITILVEIATNHPRLKEFIDLDLKRIVLRPNIEDSVKISALCALDKSRIAQLANSDKKTSTLINRYFNKDFTLKEEAINYLIKDVIFI